MNKLRRMDVLLGGMRITAMNTLRRLRRIFISIIKNAGALLLKLPLASIRLLARIGNFLLDQKNRKLSIFILSTASVLIISRTLVNQANRKRLH